MRVESVPDPSIKAPTDALVRVVDAAICGSDLWPYRGVAKWADGARLGHEFTGIVEAVGADVRGVRVGDFVAAPFSYADGSCDVLPRRPLHVVQARRLLGRRRQRRRPGRVRARAVRRRDARRDPRRDPRRPAQAHGGARAHRRDGHRLSRRRSAPARSRAAPSSSSATARSACAPCSPRATSAPSASSPSATTPTGSRSRGASARPTSSTRTRPTPRRRSSS